MFVQMKESVCLFNYLYTKVIRRVVASVLRGWFSIYGQSRIYHLWKGTNNTKVRQKTNSFCFPSKTTDNSIQCFSEYGPIYGELIKTAHLLLLLLSLSPSPL